MSVICQNRSKSGIMLMPGPLEACTDLRGDATWTAAVVSRLPEILCCCSTGLDLLLIITAMSKLGFL